METTHSLVWSCWGMKGSWVDLAAQFLGKIKSHEVDFL